MYDTLRSTPALFELQVVREFLAWATPDIFLAKILLLRSTCFGKFIMVEWRAGAYPRQCTYMAPPQASGYQQFYIMGETKQ